MDVSGMKSKQKEAKRGENPCTHKGAGRGKEGGKICVKSKFSGGGG